jgi:ubiquinone biosynthesis UbiH/UbiF/VisC/COQ6 family hydroxylase
MMGIGTNVENFGKNILLAQMDIEHPHNHIAYECFHYGYTLAILPLLNNQCSIVMTLQPNEATTFMNMPSDQFSSEIEQRFSHKYGKMHLAGERRTYPLTSVYANKFVLPSFALLGDAAVGMHPVTAHGFNFGVQGQHNLAHEIIKAHELGLHIGSINVLKTYEQSHRVLTKPLYLATNSIVKLFTNDSPIARHARDFLLKAANYAFPIKNILVSNITKEGATKRSFPPVDFLLKKILG